jgi:hypothetical protein
MADLVVAEPADKLQNALPFQWDCGVAETRSGTTKAVPPALGKGFDAGLLSDLCNAIALANAAGKLGTCSLRQDVC